MHEKKMLEVTLPPETPSAESRAMCFHGSMKIYFTNFCYVLQETIALQKNPKVTLIGDMSNNYNLQR